jgi:hypothetical protein
MRLALFSYSEGRSLLTGIDATSHAERAISAFEQSLQRRPDVRRCHD